MANKRDYYEVLGIDKNATDEDIKRAYRKKAKECHPDLHPNDKEAEARFKELNEANEVLSDPDKRARYDQFGFDGPDMGGGAGGNPFGGMDFSGMGGMGDIFDQLFNGGMGGSAQARRNAPRQGNDVRYELRLTFEEAAKGCHKSVEFYRYENCATCGGSGAKPGTQPQTCSMCKGTGQIRQSGGWMTTVRTCAACGGSGLRDEIDVSGFVCHVAFAHQRDGRNDASGFVTDRSPDAADAVFEFFVVFGPTAFAYFVKRHDEALTRRNGFLRAGFKPGAGDVARQFVRREGAQEKFAARRAVQRRKRTDLTGKPDARVGAADVVDIDDAVARAH